jgi:hypothetical protein
MKNVKIMKSIILVTIMMLVLSSVSSAILFPTMPITTIKYYVDATHNTTGSYMVETYKEATVSVISGDIPYLATFDTSTVNIYGGDIGSVWMTDKSIINFFGGNTISYTVMTVDVSSELNIFGYDFMSYGVLGDSQTWGVRGKWADFAPFGIEFRGTEFLSSNVHLHTIPEPATVLLLGCGLVCCYKKGKIV